MKTILVRSRSHPSPWPKAAQIGKMSVALAAALAWTPMILAKESPKSGNIHLEVSHAPVTRDGKFTTSFAPLVKNVAPSVVKVSVTTSSTKQTASLREQIPDAWRRFFGDDENESTESGPRRKPKQHGVGSGVIVTANGYILTNNHVVEGANAINVSMNDGREYNAKIIGRDPKTDIAVLKIDAHDLPFITLADSDQIEVGDLTLAIGNPFGIGQTVTTGIISAKGRATLGLDYEDFIQTDAAINPGNSGGALVDTDGRLIGINTAILSHSGGNQGIGFAVPTNLARWVMESLVETGRVERGFLGVNIQDLTPQLAKEFKLELGHGALVSEVTPNSPAERAGVKNGDVIVEFNGKPITDSRHLKLQVGVTLPGVAVPLKVQRDGRSQMLQVTVQALASDKVAKADSNGETVEDALHGVAVATLDPSRRAQFHVPEQIVGALVAEVAPDSAAYEAGVRPGDVITEINRRTITNAEEAVTACAQAVDKETLVKVWSRGGSRYVVVDEAKS